MSLFSLCVFVPLFPSGNISEMELLEHRVHTFLRFEAPVATMMERNKLTQLCKLEGLGV